MAFLTDDRSHAALPDHVVLRLIACIYIQRLAFVLPLNEGLDDIGVMDARIRSDVFLDKFGLLVDLNIALTSFALINIDEFDKTTNSQQIVLKYLLSSSDVKFRPPYGKTIKQYRRYTSFIGTTNQLQPLVDPTGSRRFVCVGIPNGKNIDFTDNLDHRQLYAQALHLFNKGERFWLEDGEIQTLIEENVPYQRTVDLVEMINETFRKPKDGEGRWWGWWHSGERATSS